MGCDIHCMLEYKGEGYKGWSSFSYNTLNLGRDYGMFASMANVRNYGDVKEFVEPKGLPEDISWATNSENTLYISEDENDEESCSKENAERWVNSGSSKYTDESKKRVTHPDWHSHSWLNSKEYEKILNRWESKVEYRIDPKYYVVLAMLKIYEERKYETRLVFWFDN